MDPSDEEFLEVATDKIGRLEAEISALESRLQVRRSALASLKQAVRVIQAARDAPDPGGPAEPRIAAHVKEDSPEGGSKATMSLPTGTATLVERIREVLEARSERPSELAVSIGTTPELMESTLNDLERRRCVCRFDDGAYTWCVGDASATILTRTIKRYMLERHVSRRELMSAIGADDELLEKRVDNQLDSLRATEHVWAQRDLDGHTRYWLAPGHEPPPEFDGRKPKRVRSRRSLTDADPTPEK